MPSSAALLAKSDLHTPAYLEAIREIAKREIAPAVGLIDEGKLYPAQILKDLGTAGAWRQHLDVMNTPDILSAIEGIGAVGEVCGATAFMAWCQNTLAWYIANSPNGALRNKYLEAVASGQQLGGTGLSNPMKSFFGIEKLRLKAKRVEGGWRVKGNLPWVSNLSPDHLFGTICENADNPAHKIMILVDCADPQLSLLPCDPFLAMDGTGTYGLQFSDVLIPDDMVLAEDAMPYVLRIRAGFILLQSGMATGIIRDCISIMERTKSSLGHVNCFLAEQPEDFANKLADIEKEVALLCQTPFDTSKTYWKRVVEARLVAGEVTVAAAHAAMLHTGARGYLKSSAAQRRIREAYFVAIVTPATK
jgi:alkylation response protein AidB-like acyl-CoA dehydrogenase